MEPPNRFVTEVLGQEELFLEKYDRGHEFVSNGELAEYGRERDEQIKYGQDLLKEIEAPCNKLPLASTQENASNEP